MPASILENHPKQRLLFFVAQDVDQDIREAVRQFVLGLASLRQWLTRPPCFVDSQAEPVDSFCGSMTTDTVGGYLEIYSAQLPLKLPVEVDRQHLAEVTTLVSALCDFSREKDLEFELELDNTFVGVVSGGEMDRSLAQGLLGEWRRQLGED